MPNITIAITGAGSGIGRALAHASSKRGYSVALSDVNLAALEQLKLELKLPDERVSISQVDVSDFDAVCAWREQILAHFSGVDILINNAGVALISRAENQSNEDLARVMDINFWGVVHGCKAFLPALRESKNAHLVNISSIFGIIGVPSQSAYNASKFAVRGYTEALRQEIEGDGIHVCCVHPGGIKTNIARSAVIRDEDTNSEQAAANFDTMAITSPDQAAAAILKAIDKRTKRLLIGRDAKLMNLIARLFPVNYPRFFQKDIENARGQ